MANYFLDNEPKIDKKIYIFVSQLHSLPRILDIHFDAGYSAILMAFAAFCPQDILLITVSFAINYAQ